MDLLRILPAAVERIPAGLTQNGQGVITVLAKPNTLALRGRQLSTIEPFDFALHNFGSSFWRDEANTIRKLHRCPNRKAIKCPSRGGQNGSSKETYAKQRAKFRHFPIPFTETNALGFAKVATDPRSSPGQRSKAAEACRMKIHKGRCNCGAVKFEVNQQLKAPDACHCASCRRWSGHYFVSTDLPRGAVSISGIEAVTWYSSPERPEVRRGFCSVCGCNLFWEPIHHDWIGVAMGAFENPTSTEIGLHIYVADKGDYYEVDGNARQYLKTPREG